MQWADSFNIGSILVLTIISAVMIITSIVKQRQTGTIESGRIVSIYLLILNTAMWLGYLIHR